MSQVFRLVGEYSALPFVFELGVPQAPEVLAPFLQSLYLIDKLAASYSLAADAPVVVSLGSMPSVGVVVIQTTGKVRVRFTSADGTQQAVPVDSLLILLTSIPFTAIDITRLPGITTEASVFLGQRV